MGKIFLIGLLLIIGTVGLAVDFSLTARDRPPGDYSISDHLASRTDALKSAIAAVSTGSGIVPQAPEGWTRHRAAYEDSLQAYGVTQTAAEIKAGKALEKSFLDALPGYKREYVTYQRENQIIVLDVVVIPLTDDTRAGRLAMGTFFRRLAGGSEAYVNVEGVELASVQNHATGTGRLILGQMDGLVYISAASNADDDMNKTLLQGIDVAALRKMIADTKAASAREVRSKGDRAGAEASATVGSCVTSGAGKFCSVND